jgi:hypothetical protein
MILFVDSSHQMMNAHSSSSHVNEHYFQYFHPFDHHQQMTIQNNSKQRETTNHLNEDEHCQICGDLASGWHCG